MNADRARSLPAPAFDHAGKMRKHLLGAACAGLMVVVASASPGAAHAVLNAARPDEGTRLEAPPEIVRLSFTEPPTTDANVVVLDGCGANVVTSTEILDDDITLSLAESQPGRWSVRYQVVSAVDGHPTTGGFSFTVAGESDCAAAADAPEPNAGEEGGRGVSLVPLLVISSLIVAAGLGTSLWLSRAAGRGDDESHPRPDEAT